MALPLLQSYTDAKMQKAYERYVAGESQRKIIKALKIAPRTLARRCKDDGWEAERQAHRAASAMAASESQPLPNEAAIKTPLPDCEEIELRSVAMERMLREWQGIVAKLRGWVEAEVKVVFSEAAKSSKRPTVQKMMQLGNMANSFATLDKKVWCVPEKIAPTSPDGNREYPSELTAAERAAGIAAILDAARTRRDGSTAEGSGNVGASPGSANSGG